MLVPNAVYIIYNPNSAGNGKELARALQSELEGRGKNLEVEVVGTKQKGDGERLAYRYAKSGTKAVIVSASGDGGYHDVINGLMRANSEGAKAVAGLLPGGNANDHYVHMHKPGVTKRIASGSATAVDLLLVTSVVNGKPWQRYAHSYVGFGLTPHVGEELNKTKITWYNQVFIVLRGLATHRAVPLRINGQRHRYESVICSNIATMSKVLKISDNASSRDGKMELSIVSRRSKLGLVGHLLLSSVNSMPSVQTVETFECYTCRPALVQLDGELTTIDTNAKVTVDVKRGALQCII